MPYVDKTKVKAMRKSVFGAWFGGGEQKETNANVAGAKNLRSSSLSILGMGPAASSLLLPQQQRLLLDMGHHLRMGVAIVKVDKASPSHVVIPPLCVSPALRM